MTKNDTFLGEKHAKNMIFSSFLVIFRAENGGFWWFFEAKKRCFWAYCDPKTVILTCFVHQESYGEAF